MKRNSTASARRHLRARARRSRPRPGPGEVLVRVHAAALTRDELEWPTDRLPAIPSYELSGVAVESGEEVYALTPFDRDGVAAEYAVVPAVGARAEARSSQPRRGRGGADGRPERMAGALHPRPPRARRAHHRHRRLGRRRPPRRAGRACLGRRGRDRPAGRPRLRHRGRKHPGRGPRRDRRRGGARRDLLRRRAEPRAAARAGAARRTGRAPARDRLDVPAHRGAGGVRAPRSPGQAWQGSARCRRKRERRRVRRAPRRASRS